MNAAFLVYTYGEVRNLATEERLKQLFGMGLLYRIEAPPPALSWKAFYRQKSAKERPVLACDGLAIDQARSK